MLSIVISISVGKSESFFTKVKDTKSCFTISSRFNYTIIWFCQNLLRNLLFLNCDLVIAALKIMVFFFFLFTNWAIQIRKLFHLVLNILLHFICFLDGLFTIYPRVIIRCLCAFKTNTHNSRWFSGAFSTTKFLMWCASSFNICFYQCYLNVI